MPIELYLKILKVFADFYHKGGKKISAELCCDITNALIPICLGIEEGKYDIKAEQKD